MSDTPIGWLRSSQTVPQFGTNPEVLESAPVACVGGPCDGQAMRCPAGYVLVITDAVDGLRATAVTPQRIELGKSLGGYAGHYERAGDTLTWRAA
jgi:hypothetical protein